MTYLQQVFKDMFELKPAAIAFWAFLVIAALVVYLAGQRKKWNTRTLVIGSLCIALSFGLSYIRVFRFPQGGSITPASMLPLMTFAYLFGPAPGLMAGLVYSLLQLIQDFYIVHPVQLLLDYILAFGALGLTGFFRKNFAVGMFVSGLTRFLCHFISGMVFFGSYAPEGMPVSLYSLGYNALVIGPDLILCMVVAYIPQVRSLINRLKRDIAPKA